MASNQMYIKIDEFEKVVGVLQELKQKTTAAREKLKEIRKIKIEEERSLKEWEERVDRIDFRLNEIHTFLNAKTR